MTAPSASETHDAVFSNGRQKIRAILADDHSVVRAGIRTMLESLGGIQIVGQAANGREAVALVEQLQPDIALLDISMPEMNGLEATGRIVKDFPSVRVVIVSMHTSEEYVWQALRAGAVGYLPKDVEVAELGVAVDAVISGKTYLTPGVSRQVVENYIKRMGSHLSASDVLTPRQREILQLIAEGNSLKEIARILNLSVKTVETHRSLLMERLEIYDTPGLVKYAMRMGIIPLEA